MILQVLEARGHRREIVASRRRLFLSSMDHLRCPTWQQQCVR